MTHTSNVHDRGNSAGDLQSKHQYNVIIRKNSSSAVQRGVKSSLTVTICLRFINILTEQCTKAE